MIYREGTVTVELIRDNGKTLIKYAHNNEVFVDAPKSGNYSIRLKNNSSQKKLVVISVDGRNTMDGESAGYNGDGYVLYPWQTWDIKGWRRTGNEVAAFEFTDVEASYDVQMGGSGSNVGVIGVAVFDEKRYQYWTKNHNCLGIPISSNANGRILENTLSRSRSIEPSFSADSRGTNYSAEIGEQIKGLVDEESSTIIGTGYGQKKEMKTVTTTFEKASETPSAVIVIRYATEQTLRKWGVIREPVIPMVNPFPEEKASVKAPPGWKG